MAANLRTRRRVQDLHFSLALIICAEQTQFMIKRTKGLFSILIAVLCSTAFPADEPNCKSTGKNCSMNNGKQCACRICGCEK
jgi:hypothetical protein